ncbi:MAG: RsmD family RNA methyltransferase [Chitinophagaceae bacterium]|nr:RsmD family RNA methyltransferase [Bacteroidota bacterium]MBS1928012.1 RsmD family RNA methyltransferase [Bacteroidota bacterium]MCC6257687.1 RsmD family RNA methyltransferase [Chitinophagaceae bacterium]MCW5917413.1 RsmD family RNA methyltransferase [Ferruginibacter sp.]
MRIIGGSMGGRRITPPPKMPYTRPTTDIAKEGLFNIIENNLEIDGLVTLDLFGGTGSISYELASRGAADLTIVEKDPEMFAFIKRTTNALNLPHIKVVKSDVFRFIREGGKKYDLIFAGPPYALSSIDEIPIEIFKNELLKEEGWFILEHTPKNDYRKFDFYRTERNYGTTIFSIFVNRQDPNI